MNCNFISIQSYIYIYIYIYICNNIVIYEKSHTQTAIYHSLICPFNTLKPVVMQLFCNKKQTPV